MVTCSPELCDRWKVAIDFVALLYSARMPLMVRSVGHLLGVVDTGFCAGISIAIKMTFS
jgi:hypothetical protein